MGRGHCPKAGRLQTQEGIATETLGMPRSNMTMPEDTLGTTGTILGRGWDASEQPTSPRTTPTGPQNTCCQRSPDLKGHWPHRNTPKHNSQWNGFIVATSRKYCQTAVYRKGHQGTPSSVASSCMCPRSTLMEAALCGTPRPSVLGFSPKSLKETTWPRSLDIAHLQFGSLVSLSVCSHRTTPWGLASRQKAQVGSQSPC